MASPIAHSFAGFWTFLLVAGRSKLRLLVHRTRPWAQLAMLVLAANLADFDFLLSLAFRGNLNDLHHEFSHSLLAAIVASLGLACLWRVALTFWRSVYVYFVAYGSHLLIDLFTGNQLGWNGNGSGIPLFWPWEHDFRSPFTIVLGVQHKNISALWSMDNALSTGYELLLFSVLTAVLLLIRSRYVQND